MNMIIQGDVTPETILMEKEICEEIDKCLDLIMPRERLALESRYWDGKTLDKVGKDLGGITKERVRQIIAKAERRLKHPSRSHNLRQLVGDDLNHEGSLQLSKKKRLEQERWERFKSLETEKEYHKNKEWHDRVSVFMQHWNEITPIQREEIMEIQRQRWIK